MAVVPGKVALAAVIDSIFNPTLECYFTSILALPQELRNKAINEIMSGLIVVLNDLAKYISSKDKKAGELLAKLPKSPIKKLNNLKRNNNTKSRVVGGGRGCIIRRIEELKESNTSFQFAKENVDRLIKSGASQLEITRAQSILFGMEEKIREQAEEYCKSSIMPVIIGGAASLLSKTYLIGLSALGAYSGYRLSGVPTKMVVGTTAIGGNIVGSVVGSVASAVQGTMNLFESVRSFAGFETAPYTFAEGIGDDYGKKASETVLDSIKGLGEEDVKISMAIIIFISLLLLLTAFSYIGQKGNDLVDIMKTREVTGTVTPLGGQFAIAAPGSTQITQGPIASQVFGPLLENPTRQSSVPRIGNQAPPRVTAIEEIPAAPASAPVPAPGSILIEEITAPAPVPAPAPKKSANLLGQIRSSPLLKSVTNSAPAPAPSPAPVAAAAPVPANLLGQISARPPLKPTKDSAPAGVATKAAAVTKTPFGYLSARMLQSRKAIEPVKQNSNSNWNSNLEGGGKDENAKRIAYEVMVEKAALNYLREWKIPEAKLREYAEELKRNPLPQLFPSAPAPAPAPAAVPAAALSRNNYLKQELQKRRKTLYGNKNRNNRNNSNNNSFGPSKGGTRRRRIQK
jgi:hypothetical protein